ncbi:MAG: glycoside hydrolase family 9 protein [Bacteroidetes bacterium]|nr:glycoside hydrolase family 9 protein [Bacteroidota bacterium]
MGKSTKHLSLSICFFVVSLFAVAVPATITQFIKIDQFGYKTTDQKIAVISDPQIGYNSAFSFAPGTTYQVRNWITDAIVFSGAITVWNSGATHAQSGDVVYWFDFSSVVAPGSYYVFDPTNNVGSYRFEINDCVYNDVLKISMRMFYYQRCGFAKSYPFVDTGYVDGASHLGTQQDLDCRLYSSPTVGTSKNLSGGWYDAGDYNKYVNFTWSTLCDMLLAYEERPSVWADDYNIPESGNSIPDILDEVKYELDWLLKMQNSDGSVLSVIGGGGASPPSADGTARRYGPANTSATLSAAGIFALAAKQYNAIGMTTYGTTLQTAAINAWTWANANPSVTFYNSGVLAAGEQELDAYGTLCRKFGAAVYLYALTGNTTYRTFVDANYNNIHLLMWTFAYPFEGPEQDMCLYYAALPGATVSVRNAINAAYTNSLSVWNADNLPAYTNSTDAYRAYLNDGNYTWNSNQTKSKQANMFLAMNRYNFDAGNATNYTNAASGFLHYFHGVNPNSKTYLSNMSKFGAENSVTSFYHSWFHDGSALWDEVGVSTYGPAPGFIPGGVNPSYDWDGCCPSGCGSAANNAMCVAESLDPPKNQPIQKSWKDFNTSWPVNSWTISEAGIYTQAAYVRMLSKFATNPCVITTGVQQLAATTGLVETLYPQPAENKIAVKFYGHENTAVSIHVVDVNGKEVLNQQEVIGSNSLLDIDVTNLSSGIYFIRFVTNNQVEVKKMVKN